MMSTSSSSPACGQSGRPMHPATYDRPLAASALQSCGWTSRRTMAVSLKVGHCEYLRVLLRSPHLQKQ
ncbi:hypothetical protein CIB84_003359 [Bambusicola thoracicus]|uniref:Uncharacterized protein n=1 Tax=Bambusicola thoracicus TaxID=9083 RepID=A0A2P4T945_BAMTH|nr:hypothetical protein CIB84_003359 [Bambusicola thoracicus]